MENQQNLKIYNVFPGKQQVIEDFKYFLELNPQFRGNIMIGTTFLEKIEDPVEWRIHQRFSSTSKYERLTSSHVFVPCVTQEIALQTEEICQEYAKEKGMLIYKLVSGKGTKFLDQTNPIVFITKYKTELYKCPQQECQRVMTYMGIQAHKMSHNFIVNTIEANKLLEQLGIDKFSQPTDPIPVSSKIELDLNKFYY